MDKSDKKYNSILLILGQNVRDIRKSLGLTQEEFSEKLNITPNHLSKIENGNTGISLDNAINICKIGKCSANILFKGIIEVSNINDKFELLDERDQDVVEQLMTYLLDKHIKN